MLVTAAVFPGTGNSTPSAGPLEKNTAETGHVSALDAQDSNIFDDGLVPLPRLKPEINALALLSATRPPLPQKRPAGIDLPPSPLATGLLSLQDLSLYRKAFAAADRGDFEEARAVAANAEYRLPAKILDWRWMTRFRTSASFDQITAFIRENPDWPLQEVLRRRAEEALADPVSADRILAWFSEQKPLSGVGMLRYGEALTATGHAKQGDHWIRRAWISGYFPNDVEEEVLRRHKGILTRADHEKRLDHLLWDQNAGAAIRLFPYVSKDAKKLAIARIRLMRNSGNVDAAIRAVPADLQDNPGLVYERAKWRRRNALNEESRDLLLKMDDSVPQAEKWWPERHLQARKLLQKGYISEAYKLVSQHGLEEGKDFAAAEWLSGWIALQFLGDGDMALGHFVNLYENVSYPISRSRGAYWIGRAQAARGEAELATYWYKVAARYYTTFYGQMALRELGIAKLPPIPRIGRPAEAALKKFNDSELVLAVRHLGELDMSDWAKPFLLDMAENTEDKDGYIYLAHLATKIGRPDYAIAIAKQAAQQGTDLTEINWPTPAFDRPENPPIEQPLIFAITRQESAFASDAVSHVGARGLMQLMPGTAKVMSRRLNVDYSRHLLTDDPSYNTLLGSSYLADLIDEFDGSYVLAIAAYNAGPANVRRWIRDWGDPRTGDIDMIDWIELIPYSETRNYVQRVIENLQIYRERLTGQQASLLEFGRRLGRDIASQ